MKNRDVEVKGTEHPLHIDPGITSQHSRMTGAGKLLHDQRRIDLIFLAHAGWGMQSSARERYGSG